jgi:hypothetical protein
MSTLQQTLPVGQSDFPQGLFFSGTTPSQTERMLTANLRRWLGTATRVVHIDLHSGLGKWGEYHVYLTSGKQDRQELWQQKFGANRLSMAGADDPNYYPQGSLPDWCQHNFANLDYDVLTCEFGTYSLVRLLKAMRAENRAHWWGNPDTNSYRQAKQDLVEVFSPRSLRWQVKAITNGLEICDRSISAMV